MPFSEEEIRNFLTQVFQGLAHMHKNGYFHRDLKPGIMFISLLMPAYNDPFSVHIFFGPFNVSAFAT